MAQKADQIIKAERLGITHVGVGDERWQVGVPVTLTKEQVEAIEQMPGYTVEKTSAEGKAEIAGKANNNPEGQT